MGLNPRIHLPGFLVLLAGLGTASGAQVFTVGEKSATDGIKTDFKPTHVELPDERMGERTRRELLRDLVAEQGFAHRVLPLGGIFTLQANGNLTPGPEAYKKLIYEKGTAAAEGDRVAVTALEVKPDRIVVDLNGGPYARHRFLSHVQIGVGGAVAGGQPQEPATGCRVILLFEGGTPAVSASEVKALLEPVVGFGARASEVAYADTLPPALKIAVQTHDVLVGMNHRMVLAALGQPESKVREGIGSERYEEWIYGHQPQTVRFVRFAGDRVTQIKTAAMGKAMDVHDKDETGAQTEPDIVHASVGDVAPDAAAPVQPSLRKPGETLPAVNGQPVGERKVQYPPTHAGSSGASMPPASPRP